MQDKTTAVKGLFIISLLSSLMMNVNLILAFIFNGLDWILENWLCNTLIIIMLSTYYFLVHFALTLSLIYLKRVKD
jgi:hypothetical protein